MTEIINKSNAREICATPDPCGFARDAARHLAKAQAALDDIFYTLEARGWTGDELYSAAQDVGAWLDAAQDEVGALCGEEG